MLIIKFSTYPKFKISNVTLAPETCAQHIQTFSMKKQFAPSNSFKQVGDGLYLSEDPLDNEKQKPVPNNAGKKYFKWTMAQRNTLLRECFYHEVWTVPAKKKSVVYMDIVTILKSIPNMEVALANLDWRKCQDEYNLNVDAYNKHREEYKFKSGTDEEHTEWQDIMEDIVTRIKDYHETGDADVSVVMPSASESKELEKDLQVAGVLLRDKELTNSNKKRQRFVKTHKPQRPRTQCAENSSEDDADFPAKKLKPMDRLAVALAEKIEQDTLKHAPVEQKVNSDSHFDETITNPPKLEEVFPLSRFGNLEDILTLAGVENADLRQDYITKLVESGFENTLLLMEIVGQADLLIKFELKMGHTLRLARMLTKFVNDTGFF